MIKIQDGDLYKILPIIDLEGKIIPCISLDCIYLPQSSVTLYERDGKILPKIFRQNHKLQAKKHFISVIHQGKVDWIGVGRSLFNKLIQEPNVLNLKTDLHLRINIDYINTGSFSVLPNYHKSDFVEHEWIKPFNHQHPEIWRQWLVDKQSQMWNYLEQHNVKYHIDRIQKELGDKVDLSEILSEFRDKKIDLILN